MKKIFLTLLALPLLLAGAAVEMNNDLVQLKIEPVGGRISSVKLTGGRELTAVDGLLGDNFTHPASAGFFLTKQPYTIEKDGFSYRLYAHHTGGGIDFLNLTKVITLRPGETVVDVRYNFHNLPAAMAANEYALACQNFINSLSGNPRLFYPCFNGITEVPAHGSGVDFSYYRRPSRSWMGFAYDTGGGLAFTMDYRLLSHFYGWYGKNETTQEFYFDKIRLGMDERVSTNIELILFHTLKRISGAGGGLVGEFSAAGNGQSKTQQRITLRLYSGRPQSVKVVFTARRLRDGEPEKLYETTLHYSAGGTIKDITFHRHFRQFPALFDIEARAYSHQGQLLAIFNMPLGLGTGDIAYRMIPQETLEKHSAPAIDLTTFDNSRQTPHIQWAKPLAGGKIRMLGLTPYPAYRELAELAQRMDIELYSSLFVAQGRAANNSGDYFGLLTETDISDNIDRLLQQDYDVILLGGIHLDKLTDAQRKEIIRKVENGCGLVIIGCSGKNQDIFNISPLIPQSKGDYPRLPPRRDDEHFISAVFPWYLMPVTTCIPHRLNGSVVAHTGSAPFIAVRQHGRGIVTAISNITSGGQGRMVGGLTPELPYPQENAEFREYIELYQLLFAKMIVFASGRGNGFQLRGVQINSSAGKFTIKAKFKNLPDSTENYTMTIFSCNRDGEELTRKDFSFAPAEEATFILPAKYWNGQQLIGFILRDPAGDVIDFGAESAMCLPAARSHRLVSDKPHYQENDVAEFTLTSAVETDGAEIRWQLRDAFDRVVKSGSLPAEAVAVIKTPITSSLKSRNYTFIAGMYIRGELVGRRSLKVTATPAPEKLRQDDFEVGIWITPYSYDAARQPFHAFYSDSLRQMGITTIMGNSRMTDVDFALANNFNPTLYRSGGTRPARISQEYRTTGNKMLLIRTPCLSDPEFRSRMQREFMEFGRQSRHLGASFYWFGDELSLTGYWSSAIDFCFSPSCLKGFQEFLRQKYGSVENAAAQWGRNYRSFEEFIPETATEAKRRNDGNFSAWADHLEYMDQLLCNYIDFFAAQGLLAGDPNARYFISGPQAPSAYGGNDWSIQSRVYTGLMSYNFGGLQDILHSFNPGTVDLPWILGYANYGGKVCYELWKSLQFRVRGAMGFSMASLIRPDGTLSRSGQAVAEYIPEITSGIGKLFIGTLDFAPPEVLIFYSQSSIRAAYISGRATKHEDIRMKYAMLCRNYGIPFRMISERELLADVCSGNTVKLLILPDSNAVSDRALAKIRQFIARGGKVLAEGNFAGMDNSCRTRKRPVNIPGIIRITELRDGYIAAFNKARSMRTPEEKTFLDSEREFFAGILRQSGIAPAVIYRTADGKTFLDAETAVFTDPQGNKYILSVCKEETAIPVEMQFAHSGDVCNIRNVPPAMQNCNPLFFRFADPQENSDLALALADTGERQTELTIDCGISRDTVCHISLQDPSGMTVSHYQFNVTAPAGKAAIKLTFAENDPHGNWVISVRDVTSNNSKSITYTLK